MRTMAKEREVLQARVAEAERARDRADAEAVENRDQLRRLTEQRDNLLLGATRVGHASSPADALVELLAAAAAGVTARAGTGTGGAERSGGGGGGGNGTLGGEWNGFIDEDDGITGVR